MENGQEPASDHDRKERVGANERGRQREDQEGGPKEAIGRKLREEDKRESKKKNQNSRVIRSPE